MIKSLACLAQVLLLSLASSAFAIDISTSVSRGLGERVKSQFTAAPPIALPVNTPENYSLRIYQTAVKDQSERGSCQTFAFLGAIEAAYIRAYGSHPGNLSEEGPSKYMTYGITNDCAEVCQGSASCGCEEFDLSEEYLIHIVFSTQSTHDTSRPGIESLAMDCNKSLASVYGEIRVVTERYYLPLEKFAPYFGRVYAGSAIYPNHTQADLDSILFEDGVYRKKTDGTYECNPNMTQINVSDFEYDTRRIPPEARKNAIYGPTKIVYLSDDFARNTSLLEQIIYSDREVSVGFGLEHLDCGPDNLSDPSFIYSDGNAKCVFDLNNNVNIGAGGHQVLLVGYDRRGRHFLAKNSWGSSWSYIWLPYSLIESRASSSYFIMDVRDPKLGPSEDAMWIGKWNMDHDGQLGKLVLRRTSKPSETVDMSGSGFFVFETPSTHSTGRLGSYYDQNGVSHEVTGYLNSDGIKEARLYVDFANPEGPPDPLNSPVTIGGQPFEIQMFSYPSSGAFTFGNFASGTTQWNNAPFGTLLSREEVQLGHVPAPFDISKWKNNYKLYYNNGDPVSFSVLNIGALGSGIYYPVTASYNQSVGNIAAIDKDHTNKLFFFGAFEEPLYYHTWESGILSGKGVFGLQLMPAPVSTGVFSYAMVNTPVLSFDELTAKPLALQQAFGTFGVRAGLMEFASPVDLYLGIYAPAIDSENILILDAAGNWRPVSAGLVPWKANTTGPVDQVILGNISLSVMPDGTYTFLLLATPAGDLSHYACWATSFAKSLP